MTACSAKTVALAALVSIGSLMSGTAHAGLLLTSSGAPVLTSSGNCVTTGTTGGEDCEAAKKAAGIGIALADEGEFKEHDSSVYFDFNKASLSARARHRLDHIARKIHEAAREHPHDKTHPLPKITIAGYADRMGNADYDRRLALRRAESVRRYLVSKGVRADRLVVRSFGKTHPMAECSADLARGKMIECLREDRRVDIEFSH